jgi:hypothetical protein
MNPTLLTPITDEFSDLELGDKRLVARLSAIASASDKSPGSSLPQQADSVAALEATYRFFGNDKISPEAVFEGHVNATISRASAHGEVYVLHDTTEFRFGGEKHREGLGWLNSNHRVGFLAHYSICVTEQGRPLGSVALLAWSRQGKRKGRLSRNKTHPVSARESQRWQEAALLSGELLEGKTGIVHIMDREGDNYELYALLLEHEQRFVIRCGHDRRLSPGRGRSDSPKLYESLEAAPLFFEREVELSARNPPDGSNKSKVFPARATRLARLEVRASKKDIYTSHVAPEHYPKSIALNFVEVREVDPPNNEQPVVWRLATTEPIEDATQIAKVVDAYRRRWVIEEFFKALKTGCRYQQLQLESAHALLIALAIESAVAWRMLAMRWFAHNEPEADASSIFPQEQIALLVALIKTEKNRSLPKRVTVHCMMLELARLGGHIKNNGPPGWLILRRGLDKLLTIHRGWDAARS